MNVAQLNLKNNNHDMYKLKKPEQANFPLKYDIILLTLKTHKHYCQQAAEGQ